jgi:hypothetical protein
MNEHREVYAATNDGNRKMLEQPMDRAPGTSLEI